MIFKSYLGVARVFNACSITPFNYKRSNFFDITEQLQEYYSEKQLTDYNLNTTCDVMRAIEYFIEKEKFIKRTKGVYGISSLEIIGKTHAWVLRTIERKITYVLETLEDNPDKYFIETYYINDRGLAMRTYFITEKGMKLLLSNLK